MDTANSSAADKNPEELRRVIKERGEVSEFLSGLVESAAREIVVFAPRLDSALFNTARFSRALASFAARHHHNHARIIVEDTEQALRDNDRLVGLCRRLSDFIHMQRVAEEHLGIRIMFVVVDHVGYLLQSDTSKPDCTAAASDPRMAVQLVRRFNGMWDRSEPITSLRAAGL
jgi:hypothetical protein